MAWQDVQKQYSSADDALNNFIAGKKCRVMKVTTKGRSQLP
jgi:hypothetical protein